MYIYKSQHLITPIFPLLMKLILSLPIPLGHVNPFILLIHSPQVTLKSLIMITKRNSMIATQVESCYPALGRNSQKSAPFSQVSTVVFVCIQFMIELKLWGSLPCPHSHPSLLGGRHIALDKWVRPMHPLSWPPDSVQ